MKYVELFEAWSAKFNRTLQGAYAKGLETGKGFGKAAKDVMAYATRAVSKEVFSVTVKLNDLVKEVVMTHDPEFILKPIEVLKSAFSTKSLQILETPNAYLTIPVIVNKAKNFIKISGNDRRGTLLFSYNGMFNDNYAYSMRFSDRKSAEDFFTMLVQSVLSSPEKGEPAVEGGFGYGAMAAALKIGPEIPGITEEKQLILDFIQKNVLSKDMREFIM
jgi:hypothetical protein